jgi:hypothetical protein
MDKLYFIMSVCSFLSNLLLILANVTSALFTVKVLLKVIGLLGTVVPIIYWLKLLAII